MTAKRAEQRILKIRLICIDPPPPVYQGEPTQFGLQDKAETLRPGLAQADGSLSYEFEVTVRSRQEYASPDFGGPFVHGAKGDRFLYLSLGRRDGTWIKRLKIPLTAITWAQIGMAEQRGVHLMATISGRGAARTQPLGDGWTVDAT